uniref:DUF1758 domain-containing protein n=1 Tax=Anopheles stephensi TaxID=30069 RepID=A0A182YSE7_ANOST
MWFLVFCALKTIIYGNAKHFWILSLRIDRVLLMAKNFVAIAYKRGILQNHADQDIRASNAKRSITHCYISWKMLNSPVKKVRLIRALWQLRIVDRVSKNVLLSTVLLEVNDAYGQRHLVRALLDNGSQPNAISESLCQQLHLPRKKVNILIVGVDGIESSANHEVRAKVQSRVTNYSAEMDFLVLRKVACDTPSHEVPVQKWNIPASYPLADPHFCTPGRIDMIIGAGYFYSLLCDGRYSLPNKGVLVESVFGWIMTGDIPAISSDAVRCNVVAVRPTIEEQLERFWKIEELQ